MADMKKATPPVKMASAAKSAAKGPQTVELRVLYGKHHLGNQRDSEGRKSSSRLVKTGETFNTSPAAAERWQKNLPNKFEVVNAAE